MGQENYDLPDDTIPVFFINGFLEAGKTEFIKYTMDQEYFQIDGKTLLIVCEEGDTDYDKKALAAYQTDVVYLEDKPTRALLDELEIAHAPERVIVEWNGMWNPEELSLPENWVLYQTITIMDGSTLNLYLQNMRALMGPMLKDTELCIINRCDELSDDTLVDYRRKIRAMGRNALIVLEDAEGEIPQTALEEELPYDLKADVIQIKPEDYGIWFMDCMDNPDRYKGKMVEFTAMVLKKKEMPEDVFVPGRMAMTCCEADMTFLGFLCHSEDAIALKTKDWVKVKAKIAVEYQKDYQGEGPVLYAVSVAHTGEIKEIVQF